MLPPALTLSQTTNELPAFTPRPTENQLYPLSAKVIVDNNLLFIELFNKNRVAIQSTSQDVNITVKVCQNETALTCIINNQEFSKASGIDSKKVALLLKREQLGLYLECMRENLDAVEATLDKYLQNKIARIIKNETDGLIKKKDFCFIQNECQRSDHQKQWSLELSQERETNNKIKYIVLSIMSPNGKRFKIEYRANNNFHLRLKKNVKHGSANLISLHVDLYSGQLIAKNKIIFNKNEAYLQNRRKLERSFFIEMANTATRLNHIPGVLPLVKAHEFSADQSKGYFFTPFCPEGDLFDNIVAGTIPNDKLFSWLRDLCLTVDEIHQNGFIHRDIKPENILIKNDKVFVADLEFAEEQKPNATVKKGTLWYVDPEQLVNIQRKILEDKNRPTIDSYALGIVTYISVFGKEMPWAEFLVMKQFSLALFEMKSISSNIEIAKLDKRLSRAILGLLNCDSAKRMPLKEAAELFDNLYRNPPARKSFSNNTLY